MIMIIIVLLAIAISGALWNDYRGRSTLALSSFVVNPDPAAPVALDVRGRATGVLGWLLTLLRLSPRHELTASADSVRFLSSSLGGTRHIEVPLAQVAYIECGYQRSLLALALAILSALGLILALPMMLSASSLLGNGVVGQLVLAVGGGVIIFYVLVGGTAAAIYYYSKRLAITIGSSGSQRFGLVFKRSVIEGQNIDLAAVEGAVRVISARLEAVHRRPQAFAVGAE